MTTWAVGDVHGNWEALERLLAVLDPGPRDRLWLTGDLVNRGPGSLPVLRWAARSPHVEAVVLGNHDLKLLACAAGVLRPAGRDTFGDVLAAPDRKVLLDWLRRRPLVHRSGDRLLVHAGLLPSWEAATAVELAAAVEAALGGEDAAAVLASPLWRRPTVPQPGTGEPDRLAAVAGILAGIRIVDGSGTPHPSFTGGPEEIPEGYRPWFEVSRAVARGTGVLFGHWARLGFLRRGGATCLDGGAAYGRKLVALALEDGTPVQVDA